MTDQSTGSLPYLVLHNHNRPLDFFTMKSEQNRLEMEQSYQRGVVWGTERKQNLIRSMLMGLPIGAITLNNRLAAGFPGSTDYAVIDGKQRITTLLGFMGGEFGVPANWFPAERVEAVAKDGLAYWDGLSIAARRKFQNTPLATTEAQVMTEAQEAMIFDLINFGGVPQGESDL